MSRAPIPYGRQDIRDEDVAAVVECLRDPYLTQGPRVARFEASLCEVTGARHAVAVSSGTAALHLAYLALGVGAGDVGITSPISFVATSNGLLYAGAKVAFADVDPTTGLVRPDEVERIAYELEKSGRGPSVVTPVDLAGQPADRSAIHRVATAAGARVLEDAAHSLGASYGVGDGAALVGSCRHADAAILSFHPVKHVTTGEGGAIVTNDAALFERLSRLRTHGITRDPTRMARGSDDPLVGPWYYEQVDLGFNYRITDLQCALGITQLARLESYVARRREIAARYDAAFASGPLSEVLTPLRRVEGTSHAYHLYVVQLRPRAGESVLDRAARRKRLFVRLAAAGVQCQVHYIPIPLQPYYASHPDVLPGRYPGAEEYYASSLSIPMFPAMTDDDVSYVVTALEECARD